MIEIYEEWMLERLDWSTSRNPEEAQGTKEQLYAQMMGWA